MPGFRTLDDVTLAGKRVLCRVEPVGKPATELIYGER